MSEPFFVLHGYGSEYSLQLLAEHLQNEGFDFMEMTTGEVGELAHVRNRAQGKRLILVSSAHFFVDGTTWRDFADFDRPELYNSLEVLSVLKPSVSAFVPHDLTEPLLLRERGAIGQFDFFFTPDERVAHVYSSLCRTVPVGWSKFRKNLLEQHPNEKKKPFVWFFSYIVHYNRYVGFERTFQERLAPILDQGVQIKFPDWPSSAEFEERLPVLGYTVIPSRRNTLEVMCDYEGVVVNGDSSIVREAYFMGRKVVNLIEPFLPLGHQRRFFSDLSEVQFIESPSEFKLDQIPSRTEVDKIRLIPFDPNRVVRTLLEAL